MESVNVFNIAISFALVLLRGLLVKGKLRWKEPFNEETVTETRQVATAQPLPNEKDRYSPWWTACHPIPLRTPLADEGSYCCGQKAQSGHTKRSRGGVNVEHNGKCSHAKTICGLKNKTEAHTITCGWTHLLHTSAWSAPSKTSAAHLPEKDTPLPSKTSEIVEGLNHCGPSFAHRADHVQSGSFWRQ